eukprot:696393-Amphidinium_carterae.1
MEYQMPGADVRTSSLVQTCRNHSYFRACQGVEQRTMECALETPFSAAFFEPTLRSARTQQSTT